MSNWDRFHVQAELHPGLVPDVSGGARAATGPRAEHQRGRACYLVMCYQVLQVKSKVHKV